MVKNASFLVMLLAFLVACVSVMRVQAAPMCTNLQITNTVNAYDQASDQTTLCWKITVPAGCTFTEIHTPVRGPSTTLGCFSGADVVSTSATSGCSFSNSDGVETFSCDATAGAGPDIRFCITLNGAVNTCRLTVRDTTSDGSGTTTLPEAPACPRPTSKCGINVGDCPRFP